MADLQGALVARLKADAAVAAIVGTKIYWAFVPQDKERPYIRLQVISDPRPEHLKGYDGSRPTRVQADCFADRHITSTDLAAAVIDALREPATVAGVRFGHTKAEGPRDLGEEGAAGAFIHRASVDLLVRHRLA